MTRTTPRKLALRKETLRQLGTNDLARVAGGGSPPDGTEDGVRRTVQCNSFIEDK